MNAIWRSLVVVLVFSTQAWAQIPFTVQPMGGTYNTDWTIVNDVDLDPGNGTSQSRN